MKGQWLGEFKGSSSGKIILNIDEMPSHFQGVAYVLQDDPAIPNSAAFFKTRNKHNSFEFFTSAIQPINPLTDTPDGWGTLKNLYPQASMSNWAFAKGARSEKFMVLSWITDQTVGTAQLLLSAADRPSDIESKKFTWDEFKNYISSLETKKLLFRGQNKAWRLRTSFHRTGRTDVQRFITEDIQVLHKHLSARTKHVFNLDIANENGAFFNLVQHHGYPTPLLDWTYSPYVAAFFAYRNISKEDIQMADHHSRVRVFLFNQEEWKNSYQQSLHLPTSKLHLSIGEFLAIENERMIPQQAASTVTNIDDIEAYIQSHEMASGKRFLEAFDLPVLEKDKVIHELRFMGITAGSMFPGLDGACEELKDRNFEI